MHKRFFLTVLLLFALKSLYASFAEFYQTEQRTDTSALVKKELPDTLNVLDSSQLSGVVVLGRTEVTALARSPFAVQVVEMKERYHQNGSIGHLLNQSVGIKLRSDGGLGALTQVSLAGLQGKAVKVFKDGIPIELFGHTFDFSTIPANMLERVEIFKGAMPVYLAADALGGGINLVSRSPKKSQAALSYEYGSFNTHRLTANVLLKPKAGDFYAGVNSTFNYSDNNYTVYAPFLDTATAQRYYKNSRRFHDATRSFYWESYGGVQHKKWVDDLRLSLIYSQFYKEIQHDAAMNKVYGAAFSKEHSYTTMLRYKKQLFQEKLDVNATIVYSRFYTRFIDTSSRRYNWDGSIMAAGLAPGEINTGNNQSLQFSLFCTRIHAAFRLSEQHRLEYSALLYRQERIGSDPLGAISVLENKDVLTVPAIYRKTNTALSLRSEWLQKRLESILAVKYYSYYTEGYTTDKYNFAWNSSSSGRKPGYLAGLRWQQGQYLIKGSYEYATRLPDEYELFGDARMVKENLDLKPEHSHNVNLNGQYHFTNKQSAWLKHIASGLFYRRVRNIIFLQPDIPFSRHINYEAANITGMEAELSFGLFKSLSAGLNLTYQNIRRVGITENMFKNLEGSRVPNIPFLFGNIFLEAPFKNSFVKGDQLGIRWWGNYIHRFFLKPIPRDQEPGLFVPVESFYTSLIIPGDGRLGQFSQDIGIHYQCAGTPLILSLECQNIANARLYDHFNVQKPGRSFHLKIVFTTP